MTIKDAVIYELKVSVDDGAIEKALTDAGITGSETYAQSNKQSVDLVVLSILEGLLATPDVSEGGYSVKYDRKYISERALALRKIYFPEEFNTSPVVKAVKVW